MKKKNTNTLKKKVQKAKTFHSFLDKKISHDDEEDFSDEDEFEEEEWDSLSDPWDSDDETSSRKYLPTLSDLIDRLTITQLKEVKIPEHKEEYAREIKDILHDINIILKEENPTITAEFLRAVIVVAQYNNHIWVNESNYRKGIKEGNNLELTHSLNGIRNRAKNIIQESVGGRKDYKIDCLAAEHSSWEPSWGE